ncbi:hypothetical protein Vretimale_8147, partial [Volvox reticuliferus]
DDISGARQEHDGPPPRRLLFCIPQAGMGAWIYHSWEQHLASYGIEVLAIELPGHNSRIREAPSTDLLQLAANIAGVIRQVLSHREGLPYAIFGHSMGAWITYEVVQDLMRSCSPLPVHLFVSGCRAPHLFSAKDDVDPTRLHKLTTSEEFWAAFRARYGDSNTHLANPKLRQLIWPVLRADFALVETYKVIEFGDYKYICVLLHPCFSEVLVELVQVWPGGSFIDLAIACLFSFQQYCRMSGVFFRICVPAKESRPPPSVWGTSPPTTSCRQPGLPCSLTLSSTHYSPP